MKIYCILYLWKVPHLKKGALAMKNHIQSLAIQGIVFRTKDLNDQGISNYELAQLIEEGVFVKLYQGVYSITSLSNENIQLTDINVIVEHGIVSLTSAAFFYKLTSGESGKVTITLNRDQKPPKLPLDLFNYFYTTSKFYDIGLNVVDQNGRQFKIYDVERTVCDIVRHRSKYDLALVREVLENYLLRDDCDIDKLLDYAKQLRVYNVVVQYLEILGGYDGNR